MPPATRPDPLAPRPLRPVPVVSDPPASPVGRVRLAALILVVTLGGDAWQSLLGWPAFIVLVVGLAVCCGVSLARYPLPVGWNRYSKPLAAFLVLCTISIIWSQYPGATALGIGAQWLAALAGVFIAVTLSWLEILRALGNALRWILGLSLVFELFTAVIIQHPIPAAWLLAPGQTPPENYEWSTASLLNGGPIQGIVGNRNLLAFLVLLALVVFTIEWVEKARRPISSAAWLGLALVEHALTRSATVLMATAGVAFVFVIAMAIRRVPLRTRLLVYPVGIAGLVALALVTPNISDRVFPLLGRSTDLTGRLDIWRTVLDLAWQHPVTGWGWVSYWAPWVAPFKGLVVLDGTEYLQAHNAWVDLFLQLGFVGLFVFGCLAAATLVRSWWMAVDPPSPVVGTPTPFQAIALLPLLLLAALLIQSLTESRLLLEGNFLLLALLATKVKLDPLPLGPPPRQPAG